MSGFVKIYGSKLITSSLWDEAPEARLVFLSLLSIADATGYVDVPNERSLARVLNLEPNYVERGLAVLMAPDIGSRTDTHEGRRVLREGAGWRCVNYEKYREFRSAAQEATRVRVEKHRAKVVTSNAGNNSPVTVHAVTLEAEAKAKAEAKKIPPGGADKPREKAADPRAQRFIAIFCEEWKAKHTSPYRPGASQRGALLTMLRDYPNMTDDAWRAFCARSQASGRPMELGQLARNLNTVNAGGGQRSFLTPQQLAEESMRQFVANGSEK